MIHKRNFINILVVSLILPMYILTGAPAVLAVEAPPVDKTFKIEAPSNISSGLLTGDGGFIFLNDYFIRINAAGQKEWQTTLGWVYGNSDVHQTKDNGYIYVTVDDIAMFNDNNTDSNHLHLRKYNSTGQIQWQKVFDGMYYGIRTSVQQTADGGYVIAGTTQVSLKDFGDVFIIKCDAQGNKEWEKTFGSIAYETCTSIRQTNDGGYITAGCRDTSPSNLGYQMYMVKVDAQGNQEWERAIGWTAFETADAVEQARDGGFVAIGSRVIVNGKYSSFYIVKTDTNGKVEWEKTLGTGSVSMTGQCIIQTRDGEYLAAGEKYYAQQQSNIYLAKIDGSGSLLWEKTIQNNDGWHTQVLSVGESADGEYAVIGKSTNSMASEIRGFVIRFKPELRVILNGRVLPLDVRPYIKNGRTIVPLRGIFEALGAEVKWDNKTQTVTAAKGEITIKLTVGSKTAYKNGDPVSLDQPAEIDTGRTMVPVRFVGEAFGAEVKWDADLNAVVVNM